MKNEAGFAGHLLSTDAVRLAWLQANAARCARLHPNADCHKRYRKNAADLAKAIDARSGETRRGSIGTADESAVPQAFAHPPSSSE